LVPYSENPVNESFENFKNTFINIEIEFSLGNKLKTPFK